MYKTGRCFAYLITCLIPVLLTGCGGGSAGGDSDNQINKPEPSSSAISITSSTASSSYLASSLNSSITIPTSSSSTPTYQRSSRGISSASAPAGETDTVSPSATKLFPHKFSISSLTILWDHATDDTGVSQYRIERDGEIIATLEYPSFMYTDKGLTPNTSYTYSIRALDQAGNVSEKSNELNLRTLAIMNTTISSSGASSSTGVNNSASQSSNSSQQNSESSSSPDSSASSSHSSQQASESSTVPGSSSSNQQSSANASQQGSSSLQSSSSSSYPSTAHLRWEHPKYRANGDYLELHDIGGYELRKKNKATLETIYLVIEGNTQTEFIITDLTGDEIIDIAVFDTNGLYSDFIPIYPR